MPIMTTRVRMSVSQFNSSLRLATRGHENGMVEPTLPPLTQPRGGITRHLQRRLEDAHNPEPSC